MSKYSGIFTETPTGKKTYEVYAATSEIIPIIYKLLKEKFGFERAEWLDGVDSQYLDCSRPDCQLSIAWDIWCGLHIVSFSEPPNWEAILHEIGGYLDTQLESLVEYFDPKLLRK